MADKVVLITGGASGIGWQTAERLASDGAWLALVDLDEVGVAAAAARLGPAHLGVAADITDSASLAHAVGLVRERFGGIDVVVANAGIGSASTVRASDMDRLAAIVNVNLLGQIRTIKATLEDIIARQGLVVFTCSAAVLKNTSRSSAYAAAKAGVEAFAGALRIEVARHGVDVGVFYPAWVPTPLTEGAGKRGAQGRAMPWPFNIVTSLDDVAEAYAAAIRSRARTAYRPRFHRCIHLVRPLYTSRWWDRKMVQLSDQDIVQAEASLLSSPTSR